SNTTVHVSGMYGRCEEMINTLDPINARSGTPVLAYGRGTFGDSTVLKRSTHQDYQDCGNESSQFMWNILLVAATWYYLSRTSSVAEQLVRGVWAARPGLTTVLFCDGILYFVMMSISISHFLTCIREAAEYPIRGFSSQSLSFIDSQGNSGPRPWLSSLEFADIASASGGDNDAYALFDLEDDMDPRAEDNAIEESNDGIELEEFATAIHVVDKCMS
ncbi:hypothetical protein POSPLADRAFT_1127780, partial [Postia placenta MAD-698-R-SB12]